MKKLHVKCLAYNTFDMIHRAIAQFESQKPNYPIASRTLVDNRYPIVDHELDHSKRLMEIANFYGWNYVKPSANKGAHGGWNWTIKELGLKDGDVLHGCDPDGNPLQPKYLDAIMDIFNNAPECFTVQLNRPCVNAMGIPRAERIIGNTSILDYHQPIAWSLGAFDCGWLNRIGGMQARKTLYGYCELDTIEAMKPYGGKWYITRDFFDEHITAPDKEYVAWKLATAQGKTDGQFSDWLKANGLTSSS